MSSSGGMFVGSSSANRMVVFLSSKSDFFNDESNYEDVTYSLFLKLFQEIGNKYALNLDSYMSTRIRHGT